MTHEDIVLVEDVLEEPEETLTEAPAIPLGPETQAIIIRGIN